MIHMLFQCYIIHGTCLIPYLFASYPLMGRLCRFDGQGGTMMERHTAGFIPLIIDEAYEFPIVSAG